MDPKDIGKVKEIRSDSCRCISKQNKYDIVEHYNQQFEQNDIPYRMELTSRYQSLDSSPPHEANILLASNDKKLWKLIIFSCTRSSVVDLIY